MNKENKVHDEYEEIELCIEDWRTDYNKLCKSIKDDLKTVDDDNVVKIVSKPEILLHLIKEYEEEFKHITLEKLNKH